jgi:hypothetical protein
MCDDIAAHLEISEDVGDAPGNSVSGTGMIVGSSGPMEWTGRLVAASEVPIACASDIDADAADSNDNASCTRWVSVANARVAGKEIENAAKGTME